MKNMQCGSPRSSKLNKHISTVDPSHFKDKQTQRNQNEDYLSPMHIKLAKSKVKPKKQNKTQKTQNNPDVKRTKRKSMKKSTLEINNTVIINDTVVKKNAKREGQSYNKLKTKTMEKTFRQTFKSDDKKAMKNQWFISFQQKSTLAQPLQRKKKKIVTIKQDLPLVSNQQYLFIGDQFFLVNNLNPTKRLLNTFREACKKDQPDCRFITQDKQLKPKLKTYQKKTNIFSEIKKQFQLKFKNEKATKIQRWWRKYLTSKNMTKNNPEYIPQQNQALNTTQSKIQFNQCQQQERKSPFQLAHSTSSPITDKIENGEDSIIASFNSAEKLDETIKPKKISFTKEDLTKLITPSYKLPQTQVNADENEAVFSSYAQFRMEQANNLDISPEVSPQKQIVSPQKSDNCHMFQAKMKQQWGLNKAIDNHASLLREFQEATKIKEHIDFRTAFQKGMIKPMDTYNTKVGIGTSILAIHSFLVNFFNFYIQRYQDEFISLINMPYGHSIQARLREIHGHGLPEMIEQDQEGVVFGVQEIIDDQKLQEFYLLQAKQGKSITNFAKANLELQKIHNKSVIDLFNHLLNDYRPYKQINGIPYPWNHSHKALTFYFVTEENIAQVFEKVEIKILKDSSILSGLILLGDKQSQAGCSNFDTTLFMQNYQQQFHPLVFEHNEERELKCCHEQIKRDPFQYNNQDITRILIQISSQILEKLTLQHYEQLNNFNSSFFN